MFITSLIWIPIKMCWHSYSALNWMLIPFLSTGSISPPKFRQTQLRILIFKGLQIFSLLSNETPFRNLYLILLIWIGIFASGSAGGGRGKGESPPVLFVYLSVFGSFSIGFCHLLTDVSRKIRKCFQCSLPLVSESERGW